MLKCSKKLCVRCAVVVILISLFTLIHHLYVSSNVRLEKKPGVIYMLQWTGGKTEPFSFMGTGSKAFEDRKCRVANCYVTPEKYILGDVTDFDVLLFHGKEFIENGLTKLPYYRTSNQKYVFASMESSANYYFRSDRAREYFNLTWTYKLDSNVNFGYITVRNKNNEVIGPRKEMHWMDIEDMSPLEDSVKRKLEDKTIAAAWFVSNCNSINGREAKAKELAAEMEIYGMKLDIYGRCGTKTCPRNSKQCVKMLQKDYYFYFAFENSDSEDYVTEKLLTGLRNYAVPVVYGGANYTRFMPDGIYLDVKKLGVQVVVRRMLQAIQDKNVYQNYFKWHNHYSYHSIEESPETNPYCNLCEYLHKMVNETQVFYDICNWWALKTNKG